MLYRKRNDVIKLMTSEFVVSLAEYVQRVNLCLPLPYEHVLSNQHAAAVIRYVAFTAVIPQSQSHSQRWWRWLSIGAL